MKDIDRLRKELSSLLSKGMSNICLKVAVDTFSELRFSGFKNFLLQLKSQTFGRKTVRGFSITLILKGVMTF